MGKENIKVAVRWWDGYKENFECSEIRFGCDLLWMRLIGGKIDTFLCTELDGFRQHQKVMKIQSVCNV